MSGVISSIDDAFDSDAASRLEGRFTGPRVARAATAEVGFTLALKVATVAQTVVLARLYAPAEIGTWATALIMVGAVSALSTFGLDRYLTASQRPSFRTQYNVAFTLTLIAGAACALLLFAFAPLIAAVTSQPATAVHLRLLTPLVFGTALALPACVWERQLRYGISKLPPLAGVVSLVVVATVGRLGFGWGVTGLVIAQLVGFMASALTMWVLTPMRPRLSLEREEVRVQVGFGGPFLVAGVAGFVSAQGDDVLVRWFHGEHALGIYLIAFYLPGYLLTVLEVIARVAIPVLAPLRASKTDFRAAFMVLSEYMAALAVLLGGFVALFAHELVMLLYGTEWLATVPLIRLLAIAFVLRGATGVHWHVLVVLFDRSRYLLRTAIISAVFMVVVAPPLIWKFGLYGGVIYSLLQLGVLGPLVRFPLIRECCGDLSYLRAATAPLLAGIGAAAVCLIMGGLAAGWLATLANAGLFGLLYLLMLHLQRPQLLARGRALFAAGAP